MTDNKEKTEEETLEQAIARIKAAHGNCDMLKYNAGPHGVFVFKTPDQPNWEAFQDQLDNQKVKGGQASLHKSFAQQCLVYPESAQGRPDLTALNALMKARPAFAVFITGEIAQELALGHSADNAPVEKL